MIREVGSPHEAPSLPSPSHLPPQSSYRFLSRPLRQIVSRYTVGSSPTLLTYSCRPLGAGALAKLEAHFVATRFCDVPRQLMSSMLVSHAVFRNDMTEHHLGPSVMVRKN